MHILVPGDIELGKRKRIGVIILELQFEKSPLHCLKTVVHGVQNQEQTQEIKLSDAMPDIGRVIGCWGQGILRGKQWQGTSVSLNGGAMVWVLYAPEDGTAPRTLESWVPFQAKWDLPERTREGQIRGEIGIRSVDGRSVSPRKIMLRVGFAANIQALEPVEVDCFQPGSLPEDVALLEETRPLTLPRLAGEKIFQLDEELTFPDGDPLPEKLVYYTLHPEIPEKKVIGGRAVFRGSGQLHVLYQSGDGNLFSRDFSLPFSQFGDLEGELEGEGTLDVTLGVTDLDVRPDSEGHLRVKCGMTAQYLVADSLSLTLAVDAYSPRRTVTATNVELDIPHLLDSGWETLSLSQPLSADAQDILDTAFYADFPRQRPGETGVLCELTGSFQVLYTTPEGSLQCALARWEASHPIPAGENCRVHASVQPVSSPTAQGEGDGIQAKAEIRLCCQVAATGGIPAVAGLQLGEIQEPDPARPSLILRRAGNGRLWDMAKATGSTMEAIRQANRLDGEPEPGRMLLIPVV